MSAPTSLSASTATASDAPSTTEDTPATPVATAVKVLLDRAQGAAVSSDDVRRASRRGRRHLRRRLRESWPIGRREDDADC